MQFIAIKKLQNNQKTLLISIDGSMRHLIDNKKFDNITLGGIYEIELKNFVPDKLKIIKHPSDLCFEIGKTDVEGKNTFAVLRKEKGSVYFDSTIFGRIACIDAGDITISKLDETHPIVLTLIPEEFKIGENSSCHWGARIDTDYIPKPSDPLPKTPNKLQKQCIGVVTKVETNDKNVKSYFCWLTDQHISSVMFDSPKKMLNLQRGDYFRANFVKYKELSNLPTMLEKEMMIGIKKFQKDKILLISLNGSKRFLVEKETLKNNGLDLGSVCEVEIKDYVPDKFKKIKHKSEDGLYFEVVGKTLDSAVGKGTSGILRQQKGSVFFESSVFGRVACVDDNISVSKLDKSHPIKVTILSEEFKVGENSVCHWGAIIDENPANSSKIEKKAVEKEKNNNKFTTLKKEEKKPQKFSEKIQKQCVGVVTKLEISEENVKSYFCWLTDEHLSSIIFDLPKRALHLQRGDFFRANFVKFKGCDKWKFVSFIERIEPLTIINFHKDTISLIVRLQNIRFANDEEFRANTEAYHPIVGNIIDPWKILDDSDSDGLEVKIVLHKFTGTYSWAISKKVT